MAPYIGKRLLLIIPVLIAISFLIFCILSLTSSDPVVALLGDSATPDAIAELSHELGLDKPFLERYADYMLNLVSKFDLGMSYKTRAPVTDELVARFPVTLKLAVFATILAGMIGIPLGILSAVKQYSLLDTIPTIIALILTSTPMFWLGLMMIYIFSLILGLLPTGGIGTQAQWIMPTIVTSLPTAAVMLRYTRSSMLETVRQDYITTARAKGVKERDVIWKHALRNALLPIVTILGLEFAALMCGCVITEQVFGIPGMGSYFIDSLKSKDIPVVMGCSIILSFIVSVMILLIDVLYVAIDPRVKPNYAKRKKRGAKA